MYLGGQAGQRGYAMAAVLVAIAIMSIVMTALLPAWRQQVQREKEAELVFRGEQYARAINLFRKKFNGAYPPTIEALVDGRFLRKKFKDPMTGEDFQPIYAGPNPPPGSAGQRQPQARGVGILGVISKSKETSIRVYRGGSTYNAWQYVDPVANRGRGPGPAPGAQPGAPGGRPGGPGGRPGGPGGRPGGPGPGGRGGG